MKFVTQPFGTFRNKAWEIIKNDVNYPTALQELWQKTYDYTVVIDHEITMLKKSLDYKWEFSGYADHLQHESNRLSGNIISTIQNLAWYRKEKMFDKEAISKERILNTFLQWEGYLQSLEFLYYTILKDKGEK